MSTLPQRRGRQATLRRNSPRRITMRRHAGTLSRRFRRQDAFQVLRRYDRTRPRRRRVRVVARQPLVTSGKAGFAELRLDEPGASPPDVGLFATVGILGRLVLAAGAGARAQAIQSGGPKVRTISQCG